MRIWGVGLALCVFGTVGCNEPKGEDLSKVEPQTQTDLEAGKNAQTLEQWSAANPNNGAPGSGEDGGK